MLNRAKDRDGVGSHCGGRDWRYQPDGGHASVVNSFIGVLIIAVLQTGLAQIGAEEPTKRMVTGGVIVLAVIADTYRQRMAGQRFSLWNLFQRPDA